MEVKKDSSVLLPSSVVAINSDDTLVLFCQKCSLQKNWKLRSRRSLSVQMWESIICSFCRSLSRNIAHFNNDFFRFVNNLHAHLFFFK